MSTINKEIAVTPIETFTKQANDERIARTSKALAANGIQTLIAENGAEAEHDGQTRELQVQHGPFRRG